MPLRAIFSERIPSNTKAKIREFYNCQGTNLRRGCGGWIFYYSFTEKLSLDAIKSSSDIIFHTENSNVQDFEIISRTQNFDAAQSECKRKATNTKKLAIIYSGKTIGVDEVGYGEIGKPYRTVIKKIAFSYDIQGKTSMLDFNVQATKELVNIEINKNLDNLSNAIVHMNRGDFSGSIVSLFQIRELASCTPELCILRHYFAHKELQQDDILRFKKFFDSCDFDFRRYDSAVVIDMDTNKTKQRLGNLTKGFIEKARIVLRMT